MDRAAGAPPAYDHRVEIHGRQVVLRPAVDADAPTLAAILSEPSVGRWWPTHDLQRVESELLRPDPDVAVHVIELDGRVVGLIQTTEEPDPEFRHAAIDLFLTADAQGRGLGPDAIRAMATELFERRGHHRITIDPALDNTAAIRAYEKVGFRAVGRLRRYQRMPDGTWIDGLLMELLEDELRG